MGKAIKNINLAAGQKGNYETCLTAVFPTKVKQKRKAFQIWGSEQRNQTVLTTRAHTGGTAGALGSVLQLPLSTGEGWAGPGAAGHLPVGTGAAHTSRAGPLRAVLHNTTKGTVRPGKEPWPFSASSSLKDETWH